MDVSGVYDSKWCQWMSVVSMTGSGVNGCQ